MFKKILLVLFFLWPSIVFGATFTTTGTGDINDGATFGNTSPGVAGTDYPNPAGGDNFVVSSGDELTVPSGYSTITSGILNDSTTGDHGELVVSGDLTLDGDLLLNDWIELTVSAGATLDLDGNDVLYGNGNGDFLWFNFNGTSGSRATVKSTTAGGTIIQSTYTALAVHLDSEYTDFSGLGTSILSRSTTSTAIIGCDVSNCTFEGLTGNLTFIYSNRPDQEFSIANCDFKEQGVAGVRIYTQALTTPSGSESRLIQDCTFKAISTASQLWLDSEGMTCTGNIIEGYLTYLAEPSVDFHGNFVHANALVDDSFTLSLGNVDLQNNYFYLNDTNCHTVTSSAVYDNVFDDNIFEQAVISGSESNCIFLDGGGVNTSIQRNIMIGRATLVTSLGSYNPVLTMQRNTVYGSTGAVTLPLLMVTEAAGELTGTCNSYSNLVVDSDTTDNDYGIALKLTTADQITNTDYNGWYGYTGGDLYDHYNNVVITGKTEGDAGFGGSDVVADPEFSDKTVTLATWDDSLGGAGTASNAIDELFKMNESDYDSDYNITDLVAYIRDGFTPTNSAFEGTGYDGEDIGAVDVEIPTSDVSPIVRPIVTDITSNIGTGI